jgi:hypothetical protein
MRREGIRFAIGGGTALSTYTGHWRGTKDLDFYVVPQDRERAVEVVTRAGMQDYYERLPYDRAWIYRSYNDDTIVDIIWAMANHCCPVDERWVSDGPVVQFKDERVRLIPPEELIYGKMYVLQRDRCDWPDIVNLFEAVGYDLDWRHLLARMGSDAPLLGAVLGVFCWLAPDRAAQFPRWLLDQFGLRPEPSSVPVRARCDLIDRRPWHVPTILTEAA